MEKVEHKQSLQGTNGKQPAHVINDWASHDRVECITLRALNKIKRVKICKMM